MPAEAARRRIWWAARVELGGDGVVGAYGVLRGVDEPGDAQAEGLGQGGHDLAGVGQRVGVRRRDVARAGRRRRARRRPRSRSSSGGLAQSCAIAARMLSEDAASSTSLVGSTCIRDSLAASAHLSGIPARAGPKHPSAEPVGKQIAAAGFAAPRSGNVDGTARHSCHSDAPGAAMNAVMTVDLSELDAWSAQVQRASDDLTGIARNGGNSLVQTDFGPILETMMGAYNSLLPSVHQSLEDNGTGMRDHAEALRATARDFTLTEDGVVRRHNAQRRRRPRRVEQLLRRRRHHDPPRRADRDEPAADQLRLPLRHRVRPGPDAHRLRHPRRARREDRRRRGRRLLAGLVVRQPRHLDEGRRRQPAERRPDHLQDLAGRRLRRRDQADRHLGRLARTPRPASSSRWARTSSRSAATPGRPRSRSCSA